MNVDQAVDVIREALMVALFISGPILGVGLVVGLVVSLFQAVTQIQEQTLSFVPKIVGMALTVMLLVPWIGSRLMEFTERMFRP
ncbi:MAG: flagellar biosynthesis protein FliQ [Phycisphaerae bacterium]|nr:flagellar biosynthesis protein FliQ [Phycisphaerae bacterium]